MLESRPKQSRRVIFDVRAGEGKIVVALSFVLLITSLAGELSGIVSVSNFLNTDGVNGILIVWLADMVLMLLMTALQSLFIDRFQRLHIMQWMTLAFVAAFTVLRLLFSFKAPSGLLYAFVFLLSTQQLIVFPLFFWIMANDLFDMVQSKRLFPVISAWGLIGSLLGTLFAMVQPGLFARAGVPDTEVLSLTVLLYLIVYTLLQTAFQKIEIRQTVQQQETLKETLTEGWGFVKEVPAFRFLMLAMIALAICDVVIEFQFLSITDLAYPDAAQYQRFYSIFRLGYILIAFVVQSFITGNAIQKAGLKNIFFVYPVTMMLSLGALLGWPGIVTSILGLLLARLAAYAIHEPAGKAFQALVPEERRGRVSIFMDSYLYAGGSIIGVLIALVIVGIGVLTDATWLAQLMLGIGAVAAAFAVWAVIKMRASYDSSLLNWRLKRRRRGSSVLDKLEF